MPGQTVKTCTKCDEEKSLESYGIVRKNKDGLNTICKACNCANTRKWEAANPEKREVTQAVYRERHREELRVKNRDYMRKVQAENPERLRETQRRWSKTPKGIISNRAAAHGRRGVPLTPEAREWWLSLVDPQCHYCDQPAVEIDHVVPISRGGTGDLSNLVPACRSCNASKNDKTLAEWLGSAGTLTTLAS